MIQELIKKIETGEKIDVEFKKAERALNKDVYETVGACIVPKSPNNMLNKKIINKKEKGEIHEKI